jgi:hypothetical protein
MLAGRESFPPERKADMFYEIKWMVIDFLIRHNVLAVERVRAQRSRMDGQQLHRR